MTAKRHHTKRSTAQKKVISTISQVRHGDEAISMSASKGSAKDSEDAIVRQFHRIQRGYSILMNEVVKEYDLIKDWIGNQATSRREKMKQKFSEKIPHPEK